MAKKTSTEIIHIKNNKENIHRFHFYPTKSNKENIHRFHSYKQTIKKIYPDAIHINR
jgi:hypothetical protein